MRLAKLIVAHLLFVSMIVVVGGGLGLLVYGWLSPYWGIIKDVLIVVTILVVALGVSIAWAWSGEYVEKYWKRRWKERRGK